MVDIADNLPKESDDDTVEIVLVNPETNLPYDDDGDPILIPGNEFRLFQKEAAAKGMTFEQFFAYVIRLAIENSDKEFKKANFELGLVKD